MSLLKYSPRSVGSWCFLFAKTPKEHQPRDRTASFLQTSGVIQCGRLHGNPVCFPNLQDPGIDTVFHSPGSFTEHFHFGWPSTQSIWPSVCWVLCKTGDGFSRDCLLFASSNVLRRNIEGIFPGFVKVLWWFGWPGSAMEEKT